MINKTNKILMIGLSSLLLFACTKPEENIEENSNNLQNDLIINTDIDKDININKIEDVIDDEITEKESNTLISDKIDTLNTSKDDKKEIANDSAINSTSKPSNKTETSNKNNNKTENNISNTKEEDKTQNKTETNNKKEDNNNATVNKPNSNDKKEEVKPDEKPVEKPVENPSPKPEEEKTPEIEYDIHDVSGYAEGCMNLINEYRVANGLSKLSYNADLQKYVNLRVKELMTDFSHDTNYDVRAITGLEPAGENIATGTSINGTFKAWKNSSGHNYCMLYQYAKYGAVGVVKDDYGQTFWVFVTLTGDQAAVWE